MVLKGCRCFPDCRQQGEGQLASGVVRSKFCIIVDDGLERSLGLGDGVPQHRDPLDREQGGVSHEQAQVLRELLPAKNLTNRQIRHHACVGGLIHHLQSAEQATKHNEAERPTGAKLKLKKPSEDKSSRQKTARI